MADHFAIDGRRLSYSVMGEGPILVCINGFAATALDWDPMFLEHLATSNRVVLIDYRGMGESADDGKSFSIADLAADFADVIRDIAIDGDAAVLGWSMGGFVAQELAIAHPGLVRRLILLSTDAGGDDSDYADVEILRSIADVKPDPMDQSRQLLSLLFPPAVAGELFAQFGQVVADARGQLDGSVLQRQLDAIMHWRANAGPTETRGIAIPTLVATGTDDVVIPASNAEKLAARINDSWLLRFPDGGHAFMAQYPQALGGVINTFLEL